LYYTQRERKISREFFEKKNFAKNFRVDITDSKKHNDLQEAQQPEDLFETQQPTKMISVAKRVFIVLFIWAAGMCTMVTGEKNE
jgi:hypothetical protein